MCIPGVALPYKISGDTRRNSENGVGETAVGEDERTGRSNISPCGGGAHGQARACVVVTIRARDLPVGTLGAWLDTLCIASWYHVPYESMGRLGSTRIWCFPAASNDGTDAYEYAKHRNAWCIFYRTSSSAAAAA